MKRKSISRWWTILTDELGWLWVNNLFYLLCIAPSVICGFLFTSFHSYLFLVLATVSYPERIKHNVHAQAFYGVLTALFDDAQVDDITPGFAAEIAEEITAIIAKHSQVDWTNNQTIHDRISQDIDDLFYEYEKNRNVILDFDIIDKIIENVKTVALRRF